MTIQETARQTIQDRAENMPTDIETAVQAAIQEGDIGMLTTRTSEGFLHTRPMSVRLVDGEGIIYFFSNDPSVKTTEIRENSQVAVSFQFQKVRSQCALSASARVNRDEELMRQLWTEELRTWFPQGLDDPALVVLELTPETYDLWDGDLHTKASRVS